MAVTVVLDVNTQDFSHALENTVISPALLFTVDQGGTVTPVSVAAHSLSLGAERVAKWAVRFSSGFPNGGPGSGAARHNPVWGGHR